MVGILLFGRVLASFQMLYLFQGGLESESLIISKIHCLCSSKMSFRVPSRHFRECIVGTECLKIKNPPKVLEMVHFSRNPKRGLDLFWDTLTLSLLVFFLGFCTGLTTPDPPETPSHPITQPSVAQVEGQRFQQPKSRVAVPWWSAPPPAPWPPLTHGALAASSSCYGCQRGFGATDQQRR